MELSLTFDEIGDKWPSLRIGHTREITLRFIQEDVRLFLRFELGVDQPASDFYVIGFGIGFGTELRRFSVDRHFTRFDNFFRGTARSDSRLGDEFL